MSSIQDYPSLHCPFTGRIAHPRKRVEADGGAFVEYAARKGFVFLVKEQDALSFENAWEDAVEEIGEQMRGVLQGVRRAHQRVFGAGGE